MISKTVLTFLLILIGSFLFGLFFTYFTGAATKEIRKKQLDDVMSIVVNLVIFIWLGKVLVNMSLFMEDPLAVLAYPSNAKALAVSLVILILHFLYKILYKKENILPALKQLLPVFIASAFMYEFLQMTVMNNKAHWLQVLLYAALLLFYVLIKSTALRNWLIIYTWLLVQFLIVSKQSYTTVFQYSLSLSFIIILFMLAIIGSLLSRKSRSSNLGG